MTADPVAIYAAVVATIVLLWDIYKWWHSERLKLDGFVSPDMTTFGSATTPDTEGKTFSTIRVQNRGSVPCVIQLVMLVAYKNLFPQLRGKPSLKAVVDHSSIFGPRLPCRLEKGQEFSSAVIQDEEFEKMSREQRLFMGVTHTMSSKPFLVRVKPIRKSQL
jgi:hypothetical protein